MTPRGADGSGLELRGRLLVVVLDLLARLPEPPLVAAADAIGELWYRLAGQRRAQARANLARVCDGLAATGRGAPHARRAASDPDALERMVRATFRHAVRYYLEVARTASYDHASALARIDVETPDEVHDALQSGRPMLLIGMHFGAIELPAIVVSHLLGHTVTAPMESVEDPVLRHWFEATRGRVGVRIIPISQARRELLRALRGGESAGMVADRDITGGGVLVPFFGHPARLPVGPALVALEADVPIYVGSARRASRGRYRGRLIRVPTPGAGSRRERVVAYTSAVAAAFESLIADAPEQWWGAFHPVWPDLAIADGAPDTTAPQSAPGAAPQTAPGAAPQTAPGAAPQTAPGAAPQTAPGAAPR